MDCNHVRHLLSAYVDREVGPEDERRIRVHLAQCDECQAEYMREKEAKELLSSLPELELPDGWWTELTQRLDEADAPVFVQSQVRQMARNYFSSHRWVSAAVAAVFLLVFIPVSASFRPVSGPDLETLTAYHGYGMGSSINGKTNGVYYLAGQDGVSVKSANLRTASQWSDNVRAVSSHGDSGLETFWR